MAGKQAKILQETNISALVRSTRSSRYPERDKVIVLLSVKAGLRASEISKLTWAMVLTPAGDVSDIIELNDNAAKKRHGRTIPIHTDLKFALRKLAKTAEHLSGPIVRSERGGHMSAMSIVNWFAIKYRELGLDGCSSHSGRRTFVTRAARLVHKAGGSLRDVQLLAGHRSIQTTQRYIDGDSDAQRRLVSLI
ncbi:MAG: site-specific integrase [Nitrospira sp.]|nr:site-specific integrase [Nitrospira sp.]MBX3513116.1 site-specific integrase [Xanthobacteraceae bacterium]